MEQIDFVIPWVDGSDPEWNRLKTDFLSAEKKEEKKKEDAGENRYRDWENLKYWFRGVEQFAPWVHRVFFVTCGQKPDWLNMDCKKLRFVTHEDYIPKECLPTFSSHPIELNLNRIKELSEHFVYFNDDMFFLRPIEPSLFFRNGVPVHPASVHAIVPLPTHTDEVMSHIFINMVSVINRHFDMHKTISENKNKWLNPFRIGAKNAVMTMFNMNHSHFVGFGNEHLPVPILKSVMDEVWKEEENLLYQTSLHRFRSSEDVSQYLFRYWNLASGNFIPESGKKLGSYFMVQKDCSPICNTILSGRTNMICINDMSDACTFEEFQHMKEQINGAFEKLLPEKSSFER